MRRSGTGLLVAVLLALAGQAHAGGALDKALDQKVASINAKVQKVTDRQHALRVTLRAMTGNKKLLGTLAQTNEAIELGEVKAELFRQRTVYVKSMRLGLDTFSASVGDKVARRSKLMLTGKGLEIHTYDRVAPVFPAIVAAYKADLDAQFAKKPDFITSPQIKIEHDAHGPEHLSGVTPVHVNSFFGRGQKLQLASWAHVDPSAVEAAVERWATK